MIAASALLERESEVGRLSELIQAALDGRGSTVAVEGPAGIGKSALLAEAAELARAADMRVLEARGGEFERELPYGVVRQLLVPALDSAPAREQLLAGAAGLATPVLLLAAPRAPPREDPGAVLHGLYWLSANLAAERPLLVVVDDAHWSDDASLRFLSYLARRASELRLLIVYAARTGEGASEALPESVEPGLVSDLLHPAPLSEAAAAELIGRTLASGSGEFARACHRATGGNPFLLHELVRALVADGVAPDDAGTPDRIARLAPETIARAMLARLRGLGGPATQLAFSVALLGTGAELRHATKLAGLEPDSAGEAADALVAAGILRAGRPLEFVHPIVRASVYAELPPARRAEGHKRAALLLEADGAPPDGLAPHLLSTEPDGDPVVVERLRAAAEAVLHRGAPEAACAYLERACAEPPSTQARPTVLRELGSAELRAAQPGALGHLREALEASPDAATRAAAAGEIALALTVMGKSNEAVELLDPVIAEIARTDPETAMRLDAELIGAAQNDLVGARSARERLGRYRGGPGGATSEERLLLSCFAWDAALDGQSAEVAVEVAERSLNGGRLLIEQRPDSHAYYQAAVVLVWADRLEQAERYLALAIEDARARGSVLGFALASGFRSHVFFRQGRIAEAEAEGGSGLEATRLGWPAGQPAVLGYLLDVMVERADLEACETLLAESGLAGELPPLTMVHPLLYGRGHLRLAAGDAARALDDFEELLRRDEAWGMANPGAWSTRSSLALAHTLLGRRDEACAFAHDEVQRARRWGAPSAISFALRAAGLAEGGEAEIALLRESVLAVEHSPARCERARSLVELGAALRRDGHRRDAREPLREGLDLAHRSGAERLARRARDELLATGARPRRLALTGLDSLTASERRVAQMAADGLANREIAQALFVTVRTVEMHLTHAYQKLGVRSREELPAALRAEVR